MVFSSLMHCPLPKISGSFSISYHLPMYCNKKKTTTPSYEFCTKKMFTLDAYISLLTGWRVKLDCTSGIGQAPQWKVWAEITGTSRRRRYVADMVPLEDKGGIAEVMLCGIYTCLSSSSLFNTCRECFTLFLKLKNVITFYTERLTETKYNTFFPHS